MKRVLKIPLLLIVLLTIFTSCQKHTYQYRVTYLSNKVDTITTHGKLEQMSDNTTFATCNCFDVRESVSDVKQITLINDAVVSDSGISLPKALLYILGMSIILFIFIQLPFPSIRFPTIHCNFISKPSMVKSILKYICYGITIVIVFKLGLILIHYLPTIVENHLK